MRYLITQKYADEEILNNGIFETLDEVKSHLTTHCEEELRYEYTPATITVWQLQCSPMSEQLVKEAYNAARTTLADEDAADAEEAKLEMVQLLEKYGTLTDDGTWRIKS